MRTTFISISKNFMSNFVACGAAVALFSAATAVGRQAQSASAAPVRPTLNLQASLAAPLNLDLSAPDSSSSSSVTSDAGAAERFNLSGSDANQPPPRRRYSHPQYSDRMHNADGSNKLAVALGGGFGVPVGNSGNVFTTSYGLHGGVGYNFSKQFGIMGEFGYDHFGLQGKVIAAQANYYNNLGIVDPSTGQFADFSGLDANAHVWSFTVNPIYNFYQGESFGAYVTAGGGYYHKAINFTLPQASYYCDPYYGCYPITQNANFDTHTTNGGGINGALGFTFKPSRFNSLKFYTEARYVWSNAKLYPEQGTPSPISTLDNSSNSYMPVTFGIRW
jgi:hypothetical protein